MTTREGLTVICREHDGNHNILVTGLFSRVETTGFSGSEMITVRTSRWGMIRVTEWTHGNVE